MLYAIGWSQSYGWTSNVSLPSIGRDDAVCFTLDDIVFVGTGNHGGFSESNVFYAFNTRSGEFEDVAPFPGPARQYATAEEIGFKAYLIGGIDEFSNPLNDVWEYDLITDSWTQKSSFPGGARWKASSFMVNQKIYYCTGRDWIQSYNDCWQYDPSNDQWIQKATLPSLPKNETVGFALYERGYIGLGIDCTNVLSDEIYEFNPYKDEWELITHFPGGPRWYAVAEVLNGKAFIGTGEDSTGMMYNDFWAFDPSTKVWEKEENVPLPARRGVAACTIPFKGIYFAGGLSDSFERLNVISRYVDRNFEAPELSVFYQQEEKKIYISDLPSFTYVRVLSASGLLMFETNERQDHVLVDASGWAQGVYIVWVGQQAKKISVL